MRYLVHTRKSITAIVPLQSHIIISVCSPGAEPPAVPSGPMCEGVLYLKFDDLDHDMLPKTILPEPFKTALEWAAAQGDPIVLFDAVMADQILDFWLAHQDVDEVYLHCDAGFCRSPAIAAALQKIETGEDEFWFKTKMPNMLVYRTLLERADARELMQRNEPT